MSNNNKKRKFVFDEDKMFQKLVESQGRSKNEAFEEIIQNALDSDAENIYIYIDKKGIFIADDGIGMDMNTITTYFEVIGSSSKFDDETKIGKHGIGFLKFMKYGKIMVRTQDYLLNIDVNKFGRNYRIHKSRQFYQGTIVTLKYYDEYKERYSWSVPDRIRDVQKLLFVNDRNIEINGEKYTKEVKPYTVVKSDRFEAFKEDDNTSKLYSQGLLVDSRYGVIGNISINCMTKMPLDFGRKGLVDSKEKDELEKFVGMVEGSYIVNRKRFSKDDGLKISSRIISGVIYVSDIMDKKFLRTCGGTAVSISNLLSVNEIYFAPENDRLGMLAMLKGYFVLDDDFKILVSDNLALRPELNSLLGKIRYSLPKEILETEEDKVLKDVFEELSAKLHKTYAFAMKIINDDIFYCKRELKFGESQSLNSWSDGKSYIVINKKYITLRQTFERICAEVYNLLCHEYAHERESFEENKHDGYFYERYHDIVNKTIVSFGEWVGTNRYNKMAKLAEGANVL